MLVKELEQNNMYVYVMYNHGKMRECQYPVIYKEESPEGTYIFDLIRVDGYLTLPIQEVEQHIKPCSWIKNFDDLADFLELPSANVAFELLAAKNYGIIKVGSITVIEKSRFEKFYEEKTKKQTP